MKNKSSEILSTSLLVGTLDILAAILYFFIKTGNGDVSMVFKYIASGLFGQRVFAGSNGWALAGLLLHYCIAFAFTVIFYFALPRAQVLSKNSLLAGIGYGAFIWVTMNFIVLPLSHIGRRPLDGENVAINLLILVTCIGIPLSIRANKFIQEK
jgi:hypothetical protein